MLKIGFISTGYENLAIESLSAVLKKNHFRTKLFVDPILFDENGFIKWPPVAKIFSFDKHIIKSINNFSPDLFCISIISDNYIWACKWAHLIKKAYNIPIIVGGIHPSSVPEIVIKNHDIDYICVGEGEEAIVDLANAIKRNQDASSINNIWSRKGNQICKNEVRPLRSDIDSLPFADKSIFYSELPFLKKSYSILTSRGCLFSCSYCCNNVWKSIYCKEHTLVRHRLISNVIAELLIAKKEYAPKHIAFLDEIINTDKYWLLSFLKEYKEKIDLPFSCFIYPDMMDKEIVDSLKNAGCIKVQMGVQLIDEKKRSVLMQRISSNKKIEECIFLMKNANIFVVCDIILGFPNTKKKDLLKMVKFFLKSTPDHIEIFWLRYYPKTNITQWALKNKHISYNEYQAINNGLLGGGIIKNSLGTSKFEKKIIFLLYLIPLLPNKISSYLCSQRRFLFLPSWVSIISLYIVKRLIKHPRYDINIDQTISRYIHCMLKKIVLKCTNT